MQDKLLNMETQLKEQHFQILNFKKVVREQSKDLATVNPEDKNVKLVAAERELLFVKKQLADLKYEQQKKEGNLREAHAKNMDLIRQVRELKSSSKKVVPNDGEVL